MIAVPKDNIQDQNALLQTLDTSLQELTHPLRIVLCWSRLLLSETKPHSTIAMDLEIIVAEAARMNEIIRGLDRLANHGGTR